MVGMMVRRNVIKRRQIDVSLDFELEKRIIDFIRTFWTFLDFSSLFWTTDLTSPRWTFVSIHELCLSSVAFSGLFFSFMNFIGLWRSFFDFARLKFKLGVFEHSWTLLGLCGVFLSLDFKSPHRTFLNFDGLPKSRMNPLSVLPFSITNFLLFSNSTSELAENFFSIHEQGVMRTILNPLSFFSEIVVYHHSVDKGKQ